MSLSLKYFIYDEATDNLITVPFSKFEKLFKFEFTVTLIRYAGSRIKYISAAVQLENRKPVSISYIKYHILQVDQNGMLDRDFLEELKSAVTKMVNIPFDGVPGNIENKSSKLVEKDFNEKYSWTASPAIENKIKELLFGS